MISSWGVCNDEALGGFTLWLICRPITFVGVSEVCSRFSGAILMSRSAVLLNLCSQLLEAVFLRSIVRGGMAVE